MRHSHTHTHTHTLAGAVLASGGRDTDVILWDLVTESGMFRLRGHKDAVTALRLLETDDGQPTHVRGGGRGGGVNTWPL
jgi:U3 small nucleolar RNA-associated protein 12